MNKKMVSVPGFFLIIICLSSCTVLFQQATSEPKTIEEKGGVEISEDAEMKGESNAQNCKPLPETNQASDAESIQPGCYTGALGADLPSGNRDDEDWYTFSVDAGQIIKFVLTQPENASIYPGLYRPDSKSVGSVDTVGNIRTLEYVADIGGEWWVRFNRNNGAGEYMAVFSIENQNDANNGKDAGDASAAMKITPGTYQGFLKSADNEDWYSFDAAINQNINLELTQPVDASFNMVLYRPNSKNAGSVTTIGDIRTLKHTADMEGVWYIKFIRSSGEGVYKFVLDITD